MCKYAHQENEFKNLITHLDCALTQKPYKDCLHTFRNTAANTPEKFLSGELYYLSDGGYSRISWDQWNDEGVVIQSESRDEVKIAFKRCNELIHDLNTFLGCY